MSSFSTLRPRKNWLLRSLLNFTIAMSFLFSFAGTAMAQQKMLDDVTKLANWQEEYLAIQTDVIYLQDFDMIDKIISYSGSDSPGMQKKYRETVAEWKKNLDRNTKRLRKRAKALPPPPQLSFAPEMRQTYVVQRNSLDGMVEHGVELATNFIDLFDRIEAGDDTAVTEILIAQNVSTQKLIEIDNGIITSGLTTVKADNPQYYYFQLILADNQFVWHEVELTKLSILGISVQDTRAPIIADMQMEVDAANAYLAKSEKVTRDMFAELRKNEFAFRSQQEKDFFNALINMEKSFYETFAVEKKILALHEKAIEFYSSDEPIEDIEAKIELIDMKYYMLADKRAEIYTKRVSTIADLGQ